MAISTAENKFQGSMARSLPSPHPVTPTSHWQVSISYTRDFQQRKQGVLSVSLCLFVCFESPLMCTDQNTTSFGASLGRDWICKVICLTASPLLPWLACCSRSSRLASQHAGQLYFVLQALALLLGMCRPRWLTPSGLF